MAKDKTEPQPQPDAATPAPTLKPYRVETPLRRAKGKAKIGDVIQLDPDDAAALVKAGALTPLG